MNNNFIVFLEQTDGKITKSSYEVLGAALDLSYKLNCSVEAIVIGKNFVFDESLRLKNLLKITHCKTSNKYLAPSEYANIISGHYSDLVNKDIFFANSSLGKDIAASLAARLDTGIITDCIELSIEEDSIIAVRPIFSGKILDKLKLKGESRIFNLRANNFSPPNKFGDKTEIIIKIIDSFISDFQLLEIIKASGKVDISEAEIIVSGGRGLKDTSNFSLIEELSKILNGAVGASRAVVDAGWRPHYEQIGQTGKTVSPNVYIAVGISGAIQHLAGMNSSKYIVAINKDADAPIFKIADYGIVGDALEILPKLIAELKSLKLKGI
ncbi:MAG: electron transfer flavoprotein subunit alpha/FixB family protein [Melioribacteraceae bacterium]|nr:electron transfer flavoprotein subunit alpha/FixB family protein [Melioribacteraceae bacterium]